MKTIMLFFLMILGVNTCFAQDYFPLVKNSYWIYNVYQNSVLSYADSTVYHESVVLNDTTFHLFINYYIENNTVSIPDTFFLYTNYNDSNAIMISNRNQDIIDSAVYAKHSYVDGEWWMAHKFPKDDTIKVEFIGEVVVEAGTFNNCFMQGGEYVFAPNVGIVKINLENVTSYYELIKYHIPVKSGTNLYKTSNVIIYPNPVNDFLNFKIDPSVSATIELYDMQGRKVLSQSLGGNNSVFVSDLMKGIYQCRIISNEKIWINQIIIK
jgi:hypothetical protein